MWYGLIAFALIATALTRLVALYAGVSAIAYIALIPLFGATFLSLLMTKRKFMFNGVDLAIAILVLLPVLWAPVGVVAARMTSVLFPMDQFLKQMIWSMLVYLPYFALRFVPFPRANFVFWTFFVIVAASVPVIYLQQLGVIDQFQTEQSERFLSSYIDQFGQSRFRNTGFFGYTHDAGQALLLLVTALYASILSSRERLVRRRALAALPFALAALVMTSSRTSLFQAILVLVSGALLVDPFVRNARGILLRNMVWIAGLSVGMAAFIWIAYSAAPELFSTSLLFSDGLWKPLAGEGRSETTIRTLTYLLSDPFRALFGWGLGTGGIAVVQGQRLLPVNTVDQSVTILMSNFGILGLSIIVYCLGYATAASARMYRHLASMAQRGLCDGTLPVVAYFCLLALWIAFLSSATIGESAINRVYCNFLFLCLGALVNQYDLLVSGAAVPARTNTHVAAARPA